MSYILDALRKSESERLHGKVPDLGQGVQMIHKPRQRRLSAAVWVALALAANVAVLLIVFWPGAGLMSRSIEQSTQSGADGEERASGSVEPFRPIDTVEVPSGQETATDAAPAERDDSDTTASVVEDDPLQSSVMDPVVNERPTVIVPSRGESATPEPEPPASNERVPHLVELPMSFQRQVPSLVFNSHLYASDPAGRRVMINDHYLKVGDRFSGIRVDRITEEGVELSMNGRRFRVGVVRDWNSPD